MITPNEETGKIKFVIESGSFALSNDVQQLTQTVSGSTAEIFSRVTDVTSGGVRGSLVFGLNKNSVSSSIDALALGFNEGPPELASGDIHAVLSGSIAINALTPRIILAKSDGTQPVAQIGSVNSSNLNEGSIILRDSSANDDGFFVIRKNQNSFLTGSGNLGIGTTSPSTKLEVSDEGANGINISKDLTNGAQSGRLFFSTNTGGESTTLINQSGDLKFLSNATPGSNSGTERMRITKEGDIGISYDSPTERLHVSGNIRLKALTNSESADTSNIIGTEAKTLIKDVIADATYENTAFYNPETINAFAGADRWAAITASNVYNNWIGNNPPSTHTVGSLQSNPDLSNAFRVGGITFQPYFSQSGDDHQGELDEIVIEIDHTAEPLRYHAIVGIQFTHPNWRAKRVQIAASSSVGWVTGSEIYDNAEGTVAAKFSLGSDGVQKTKFTLGKPNNSGSYNYIRISKIFGYDYKGVSSGDNDAIKTGTYYLDKFEDTAHYGVVFPATSSVDLGKVTDKYRNVYAQDLNIDDWGSVSASLASAAGSGGNDNLGNHTASQDLHMAGFNIDDVDKIGIGTTNPQTKLDIASGSLRVKGPFSQLRLLNESNQDAFLEMGMSDGEEFYFKRGDNTGKVRFRRVDNLDVMVLDMANRRVGIGTENPSATLDVNGDLIVTGSITAQQYIVSSSVTHMTTQFNSGSTIFGDTLEDTHKFTGSIDVDGNITSSGNITLADTVTFNTSTTSSSAGTLINPKIAGRPLVQLGAVNFAGEGITTIGAKTRASTSHSIEEGTIVVSGSLGNIGSANSLRTKIPIAKISMLGSSCEWDLQVEIQSTSSAFKPTKITYPRVGIHLPNSLDATGYFGESSEGNSSFGSGIFQTATYSTSIANAIGGGEGADGSIFNPSTGADFIDMLQVGIHQLSLNHQGIGSLFPVQGNFEAAPAFVKGNSLKSWIKWWVPTSDHTNPNTGAVGDGEFILGALSIDTGNFGLFENVKTHDSSKIIITMKYKYTN